MSKAEILDELRRMPESDRDKLIEAIELEFSAPEDELTPEQIAELERRAAKMRAHPERGIPWETVRAELRGRYMRAN